MGRMMLLGIGGIVAIIAGLKIVGLLFGWMLTIAGLILFKVLPLVLIGWLLVRAWRYLTTRPAA
jgi:hypothetical protein